MLIKECTLEFHQPTLNDKTWVKECFKQSRPRDCEYTFGNLFIWSEVYKTEICRHGGFFFARSVENGIPSYCFPKGEGDLENAIDILTADSAAFGSKLQLYALNYDDKNTLEKLYPGAFEFTCERDKCDYVYTVKSLTDLSGKKYHGKRNHISFFEKNYDWSYEKISPANINDCLIMNDKWDLENRDKVENGILDERKAILLAFENYEELDFVGGLLRVDGEVVAYTAGEELRSDIFCTHFEKAYSSVRGAYPMINREFARHELQSYSFVNREEDLGLEGLRKAKLSYHPAYLSEIFTAERRE